MAGQMVTGVSALRNALANDVAPIRPASSRWLCVWWTVFRRLCFVDCVSWTVFGGRASDDWPQFNGTERVVFFWCAFPVGASLRSVSH